MSKDSTIAKRVINLSQSIKSFKASQFMGDDCFRLYEYKARSNSASGYDIAGNIILETEIPFALVGLEVDVYRGGEKLVFNSGQIESWDAVYSQVSSDGKVSVSVWIPLSNGRDDGSKYVRRFAINSDDSASFYIEAKVKSSCPGELKIEVL